MPWIAAGTVAAAAIGAGSSMVSSSQAAGSAKSAAAASKAASDAAITRLQPYNLAGYDAASQIQNLNETGWTTGQPNYLTLAEGALPGQLTQEQLEKTPGYQFTLSQGLQKTQNAAAAKGLGVSGAALKGAATYATGLADTTYQNQFANAQQRYADYVGLNTAQQANVQNKYSRLAGTATLGENAAAQSGYQGTTAAGQQANALIAGGQASAAGTVGAGNAITNSLNSGINAWQQQQFLDKLQKPNATTQTPSTTTTF